MLPAFILSNANKKATVRCINPQKPLVTLLLPTKSSKYSFLNKYSYVGASLRLDGESAASSCRADTSFCMPLLPSLHETC